MPKSSSVGGLATAIIFDFLEWADQILSSEDQILQKMYLEMTTDKTFVFSRSLQIICGTIIPLISLELLSYIIDFRLFGIGRPYTIIHGRT